MINEKDYSFSKYTLRFRQEDYEEKFFVQNVERNHVALKKQAYVYIAVSLMIIVILLIIRKGEKGLTVYPSLVIMASIAILIILNWSPRSLNKIFLLFKTFLVVCHIESLELLWGDNAGKEEIFFSTSCLYLLQRMAPANNLPWIFELALSAFNICYISVRLSIHSGTYHLMLNSIFILLSILNSFTIRENEREHRKEFIKEIASRNKMKMWKFILEVVHPDTTYLIDSDEFSKKKESELSRAPSNFIQKASNYFFRQESRSIKSKFSKLSKISNQNPNIPSLDIERLSSQDLRKRQSRSSEEASQLSSNVPKFNFIIKGPEDMLHMLENTEVVSCCWPRFFPNKDKIKLKEDAKATDVIQILFDQQEISEVIDMGNGGSIIFNNGVDSILEYTKSNEQKINNIVGSEAAIQNRRRHIIKMSTVVKGVYRSDRRVIKLNLRMLKFSFAGKPWLFIHFEDESQRYELKQLKELDKYKDRLLASVTHDLRTPLNMVIIMIENARKTDLRSEFLECLNFADVNAKLLQNLICDILDYSLFKERKMKLTISEFSLSQTIEEVFHLIEYQANMKNIRLRWENLTQIDDILFISDGRRLKQVLINLLTNALKFTSKGSISVKAWQFTEEVIKFEVCDTGKGMDQDTITKLFTPFNTFGNPQGIGLGLCICKSIVEFLGPVGKLYVKSVPGMGSKFGFLIFRDLPSSEAQRQFFNQEQLDEDFEASGVNQSFTVYDTLESEAGIFGLKNRTLGEFSDKNPFTFNQQTFRRDSLSISRKDDDMSDHDMISSDRNPLIALNSRRQSALNINMPISFKVLIVDDNMFNIVIIENYMKKMPFKKLEILKATSGEEAVDKFREQNKPGQPRPIDLIFMDSNMPNMDGCATSRAILEIHKNNQGYVLPVIAACTAYQGSDEEERCFDAGMNYFLTKPISEEEVWNFLKKILKELKD